MRVVSGALRQPPLGICGTCPGTQHIKLCPKESRQREVTSYPHICGAHPVVRGQPHGECPTQRGPQNEQGGWVTGRKLGGDGGDGNGLEAAGGGLDLCCRRKERPWGVLRLTRSDDQIFVLKL